MSRSGFFYGRALPDCVDTIVRTALKDNTAKAFLDAEQQLNGILKFLTWTKTDDIGADNELFRCMVMCHAIALNGGIPEDKRKAFLKLGR